MIDAEKLKNFIPKCPSCGKHPFVIVTAADGLSWTCDCGWSGDPVWNEKK